MHLMKEAKNRIQPAATVFERKSKTWLQTYTCDFAVDLCRILAF